MAEETLRVSFEDDASAPAGVAADALDRLDKVLDKLGDNKAEVKSEPINAAAVALARLRTAAAGAGSAVAAALAGIQDKAAEAAAPVRKLASVFELVKARADAARKAEDAAFASAERAANRLPTELQPGAAPKVASGFQALVGVVGKLFGGKAAGGLVEGASALSRASDKLGPMGPMLAKGGGLLAVGAAAVVAAAAAITIAAGVLAAKLLYAGSQLAVAAVSARKAFVDPLSQKLGEAGAQAAYGGAIKVAIELGLDKEEVLKKAKALIGVGFRGEEVNVILRAQADIGDVLGDEKSNAFLEKLKAIKSGKAFNLGVIEGLAETGVNVDLVLKKLSQQLGISVDKVKEQLKAGKIDVAQGMKAILAAADEQFGGAAAKGAASIPRLVTSLKTALEGLFDSVDISPMSEALANLKKLLAGPEGEALKSAVNKLFGTVFKTVFAAFQGAEGEARLARFITATAKTMEGAAIILEKAGPSIVRTIDAISKVLDRNGSTTGGSWISSILVGLAELASGPSIGQSIMQWIVVELMVVREQLYAMGMNMISGLVQGIMSGAGSVVAALGGVVAAAIAAAKAKLGIRSPSKVTGEMGSDTSEGYELGLVSRLSRVQQAGTSLAASAIGGIAANDNGAAASPALGAAAGGGVTIHVHVTAGPGTTPEQARAAGEAAGDGAYSAWRRNMARYVREERRAAA